MIKALLLIFEPVVTWEGIHRAGRSRAYILTVYLLPMLLLVAFCEGYGLTHWGKWQGDFLRLKKFSVGEVVVVETGQLLLSLVVIFTGASIIKSVGETFRGRHTYDQAFTAVAYGLSPLFLCRLLDAFSGVNPWVTWSIGILLSIAALYHGVPRMMEPDPAHAFGLYFMSALVMMLVTGLARFVTDAYLRGKFSKLDVLISHVAARLPF
jgi:uncharacterized membrane protein YecN with MAPEG domain